MPRTPSKEAHEKVLKAAVDLIAERGVEGTSMDAIASASGVSKATVYKHWENKDALLIDAMRSLSGDFPEFDSGHPKADMTALLRYFGHVRKSPELGRIWPRIIGYAVGNPAFGRALQEFAFAPRRKQVARLLKQAAANGELRKGIDVDLAMDLLMGPIMHRRFVRGDEIPPTLADAIVDYFWQWGQAEQ